MHDDASERQQAPDRERRDRTDASAGWREEYRLAGVETSFFDSMNYKRECQYCDWRGQANRYPDHLTECPGVEHDDGRGEAGREERGGGQLVADGGQVPPGPGDVVRDREDDEGRLVVAYVHPAPAREWWIEGLDATVADVNPEYPESDRVITAVYLDDLRQAGHPDARDPEILRDLLDREDARGYDFPETRVAPVSGGPDDEPDGRPSGGEARV